MGSSIVYLFSDLLTTFGLFSCVLDFIVFTKTEGDIVILDIYVDSLLMTRSDEAGIQTTKDYVQDT